MSGLRQAAVALHAVSATDQRLILAELPKAERAILRTYLRELKDLGFDGSDAASVLPARPPAPPAAPAAPATSIERVAAASPAAMAAIFRHEPAVLTAQFLARQDWPWAPAMLELLAPAKREQIRAARPSRPQQAPACQRWLFDAVLLQVDAAAELASSQPARRTSVGSSWLRRVAAWIR